MRTCAKGLSLGAPKTSPLVEVGKVGHLRRSGAVEPPWSVVEAVEAIRRFAEEEGRAPTTADFNDREELPPTGAMYRLFAVGVPAAVAVALDGREFEVGPRELRGWWTRERILAALRAHAAEHGELPYAAQWRRAGLGRPTEQTVRNVFGSWDAAIAAASRGPDADGGRGPGLGVRPRRRRAPAPRVAREAPVRREGPKWGAEKTLLSSVDELRSDTERLELELAERRPGQAAAPVLARVQLSRRAKILRLAEEMCRLRGQEWWAAGPDGRRKFVALAEFAVEALEQVELAEAELRRAGTGARA